MVALSFSMFLSKIIDGSKVNTIRQERKRPVKKGDRLQLYWKQRSPSEGGVFIGWQDLELSRTRN
jgi:type II secretory pathway component PulM